MSSLTSRLLNSLDALIEAARRMSKEQALRPIRRRLKAEISAAFVKQGTAFLRRFAKLEQEFPVKEAIADDDVDAVMNQVEQDTDHLFLNPINETVKQGYNAGIKNFGKVDIKFNLKHPRAVAYLEKHGAEAVTQINETTREGIKLIVRNGVEKGESYDKVAQEIRAQFDGFAGLKPQLHIVDRATLVALTESAMAYESGYLEVGKQLEDAGLDMEHYWATVGDDRVSEGCLGNEAAGWIVLDDAFPSGHFGPPRFPGCRCSSRIRRVGAGQGA